MRQKLARLFTLLALAFVLISFSAISCEMVMGYRTSARLPFIEEQPSKQGLYFSLYQKALENIGCTLTVRRAPKKRILKLIAAGEVDFYPGLGFSKEREQYLHYIESGIMSNVVAISHKDTPDINSLSDMTGKILLTAIGSNNLNIQGYNIYLRQAHDLSVATAIELLVDKRVDFYFYNEANIRYHLKKHPNKNIKIHPCCFTPRPLYLGFSKKSIHVQAVSNPNHSETLPASASNSRQRLASTSKAFAFQQALKDLKDRGFINKLEQTYFN